MRLLHWKPFNISSAVMVAWAQLGVLRPKVSILFYRGYGDSWLMSHVVEAVTVMRTSSRILTKLITQASD